jgi:hypothetical protein
MARSAIAKNGVWVQAHVTEGLVAVRDSGLVAARTIDRNETPEGDLPRIGAVPCQRLPGLPTGVEKAASATKVRCLRKLDRRVR